MMNFSDDFVENDFCSRFNGYTYMAAIGKEPFKTVFIINAVLNIPFSIIATLANSLVIISIWRSYSLRSPVNMLLIGLALSDLGVGLIVQPCFVAYLISFATQGAADFTCISTTAITISASFLTNTSFGTVIAISLERYLSLRLHLRYEDIITMKRVRRFLVGLWLFGGISAIVLVIFTPSYKSYFFVAGIVLFLLITTAAYVNIYRIARFHLKRIHEVEKHSNNQLRHRKKTAYNMFLVYCVLLCCYLPFTIALTVGKITGYTTWNWIAINFALTVVNINSSINPLIYCYRMREIRRAILRTLYVMALRRTNTK